MSNYDDEVPSEPPPSYNDSINDPPVSLTQPPKPSAYPRPPTRIQSGPPPPSRPNGTPQSYFRPNAPSQQYSRPSTGAPNAYNPPPAGSGYSRPTGSPSQPSAGPLDPNSLYTNNALLPFLFPRGYYCKKCKNTGFKDVRGKPCSDCWKLLFRERQVYNPNPGLPFQYPKRYLCDKCLNTGTKWKNGRLCLDCYERFAPRNSYSTSYSGFSGGFGPPMGSSGFFNNMGFGYPGAYGVQTINSPGGMPVPPGDPRLGGVLCGRCRGSGLVTFFLDQELCPVCAGLGRIINTPMGR